MKRLSIGGLALIIIIGSSFFGGYLTGKSHYKKMTHVVLFSKKEGISDATWDTVMKESKVLADVPTVWNYSCGPLVKPVNGLTHALVMEFRDKKALQTYIDHDIHKGWVATYMRPNRDKVLVADIWSQ